MVRFGPNTVGLLLRVTCARARNQHTQASRIQPEQQAKLGATTNELRILNMDESPSVPAYRVLDEQGRLLGRLDETLDASAQVSMYETMVRLNSMDKILFDSQRQGRISFYMTSFGEEAISVGSAAGLASEDLIFAQYREAGALLQRGLSMRSMLAQCFGNKHDLATKGRQMPIHYGSAELNYTTVSSPLATQMPQAAGAAYAFKRAQIDRVAVCYFGEGAASEGDAHAALNFAATLQCPVLFICRNNQYAISTPASEQFRGDGLVSRALAYGLDCIRVDGSDLFAMYAATRAARQLSSSRQRPVFIEAMSYRLGHHSTSDDSSAYRDSSELQAWQEHANPIERVKSYLIAEKLWDQASELELQGRARAEVVEALRWAGGEKKLPVSSIFEDVFKTPTGNLIRQRDQLSEHLQKYGQHYPLQEHEGF